VPDAAAQAALPAHCRVGTEYTTDLYRAPDSDFRRPDGSAITARGSRVAPVADRVFFYASTDRAAVAARPGGPSAQQTVPLASPLVVPGQTTLYVDATNGLLGDTEDGASFCVVEAGDGFSLSRPAAPGRGAQRPRPDTRCSAASMTSASRL
jgi:hypothetical protein